VEISGKRGTVRTTRLDEAGLQALVMEAEALARDHRSPEPWPWLVGPQRYPEGPPIYFDTVMPAMAPEAQAAIFRQATDATEAAGLVAAGDLNLHAFARAVLNTRGLSAYERSTYGEFSITARTQDGTGSGWAWCGYEDWSRVEIEDLIARAVDLGQRSRSPVAVEPGRYTVILEPAAVAALVDPILREWEARDADTGRTVFAKDPVGTNKIGLQMLDRRLGMISSPWDPERPASMISSSWSPIPGPVTWFEQGVLRNLEYSAAYAEAKGREPVLDPGGVRLEATGPTASLEEMIASTKRGIWVNRLSHVAVMKRRTLLLTGTTRDGTFLIENGKITKPIKNFRFTESPFFVFNKLEMAGEPVRASRDVVAPRLKVRDFDMTSLTEAI
jgi:predicted Zn-dependent protease